MNIQDVSEKCIQVEIVKPEVKRPIRRPRHNIKTEMKMDLLIWLRRVCE